MHVVFDQSNVIKLDGKLKKKQHLVRMNLTFTSIHGRFQERNLTYVIVPGLLQILDGYDLLSLLLGGFALFGSLVLRLSSELLFCWFRLPQSLRGRHRTGCRCQRPGFGVSLLFGSRGSEWAASVCCRRRFLHLWLGWFLTLLTGGFVEGAMLTGWPLVTGGTHRLVFRGRMRSREGRIFETPSRHQPLGLAGETQPFLLLQHRHENTDVTFYHKNIACFYSSKAIPDYNNHSSCYIFIQNSLVPCFCVV